MNRRSFFAKFAGLLALPTVLPADTEKSSWRPPWMISREQIDAHLARRKMRALVEGYFDGNPPYMKQALEWASPKP